MTGNAEIDQRPRRGRIEFLLAAGVFVVFFTAVMCTMDVFGLGFDEGADLTSAHHAAAWMRGLTHRPVAERFSRAALREGWGHDFKHGSVVRAAHAKALLISERFFDSKWDRNVTACRAGTAFAFAMLGALVFWVAFRLAGGAGGAAAAACLIGMPRVFAHAHLCATDIMGALAMFAAWAALWRARRGSGWSILAGALVAVAFIAKESTVVIVPLYLVFILIERPKGWLKRTGIVAIVAALAFFVLQPAYWAEPAAAARRYFHYMLFDTRGMEYPWSLYFFRRYTHGAPWHYAAVMFGITTPIFVIALMGAGWARAVAVRKLREIWFIIPGPALIAFYMLPGAPRYDCERLLIPAAGFIALAAGLGAAWACEKARPAARALAAAFIVIIAAATLGRAHPGHAVYYNALIGGPRGAVHHGLDIDYWGTGVNPAFLRRVNAALPPGARLAALGCNTDNLVLFQQLGLLRNDIQIKDWGEPAQAILLVTRPATFDNFAWFLYQKKEPRIKNSNIGAMLTGLYME